MKFPGKNRGDEGFNSINITPLTDCILVLLIIFMITGTAVQTSFNLELPLVKQSEEAPASPIIISVTKDGLYYIGDERTAEQNLKTALAEANESLENPVVIINGDSRVSYNKIMTAIDAAKRAGLSHIALSTDVEEE